MRKADHLWVAKGKKVKHLNLEKDSLTDEELLELILGPSGSLRAPTIRRGKKLFVGFEPNEFEGSFLK